jgi:hypothetical protein
MIRRSLLCLALVALAAGSADAQRDPDLERVVERLAAAWSRGDADAVAALAARSGLSVDIDGGALGPLPTRQVSAILRRLFDSRDSGTLRKGMTRVVGGTPPRAFGELTWMSRARGTTQSVRTVVFVALVLEADGWRVTQIRLMP